MRQYLVFIIEWLELYEKKSYGLVEPKNFNANIPIELVSGYFLNHYELVYETYGKLNKNKIMQF